MDFQARCSACGHLSETIVSERIEIDEGVHYNLEAFVCRQCSSITYDRTILKVTQYRGKFPKTRFVWSRLVIPAPLELLLVLVPGVAFIEAFLESKGRRSVTFQDGTTLDCPEVKACAACGSADLVYLLAAPGLTLTCPECGERSLKYEQTSR